MFVLINLFIKLFSIIKENNIDDIKISNFPDEYIEIQQIIKEIKIGSYISRNKSCLKNKKKFQIIFPFSKDYSKLSYDENPKLVKPKIVEPQKTRRKK